MAIMVFSKQTNRKLLHEDINCFFRLLWAAKPPRAGEKRYLGGASRGYPVLQTSH
jgi:hypothetical protein